MSESMLTLKNLTKVFNEGTQDEKRALDDLSLEVADGDFITIIGSNGAGKTTLLNAIAGTIEPDEGQVIVENSRANDLVVNVTKTKKLTNMRSSGADDKVKLAPPKEFTLEECLEYIQSDEYVEVTPENLRMRKILLKETDRKRAGK